MLSAKKWSLKDKIAGIPAPKPVKVEQVEKVKKEKKVKN